jgi:hypothetical protein
MIQIWPKPLYRQRNALVPSRVKNCRVHIIHAFRIRFRFRLGTEDRRIEDHVGDVVEDMILHSDLIGLAHDGDVHGIGGRVFGVVDSADGGDDPD